MTLDDSEACHAIFRISMTNSRLHDFDYQDSWFHCYSITGFEMCDIRANREDFSSSFVAEDRRHRLRQPAIAG